MAIKMIAVEPKLFSPTLIKNSCTVWFIISKAAREPATKLSHKIFDFHQGLVSTFCFGLRLIVHSIEVIHYLGDLYLEIEPLWSTKKVSNLMVGNSDSNSCKASRFAFASSNRRTIS